MFPKKIRMQKLIKGYLAKRSSFLERKGGPPAKSWRGIVDCYMLEHRKEQKCSIQPFYKKFPHPPRTSYLLPLISYLSFPYKDFLYYVLKILDKPR